MTDPVLQPARPVVKAPRASSARRNRNPLHFVVVVLLLVDIVFGLGLAVFAEQVIAFQPMAVMGFGLAALGLGILAYFVVFGARAEQKKRARRARRDMFQ